MERFSFSPEVDLIHEPDNSSTFVLSLESDCHWISMTYKEAEELHFHLGVILQEKDNAEIQD